MGDLALSVQDVMNRDVQVVRRNDALAIADQLMQQGRIRHLVVLDEDGIACAVVSQRDLFRGALLRALGFGARAEDTVLKQVLVKEAMSSELHTIRPEAPVTEAARLMVAEKIGCLPVTDGEKLVGIVTESDIVSLVASGV